MTIAMGDVDIEMPDAGSAKELRLVRWTNALVSVKGKGAAVSPTELVVRVPKWVHDYAQRLDSEMRNFQENFASTFSDVTKLKGEFPQLIAAYEELLRQQHLLYDAAQNDKDALTRMQQDQFDEVVAATMQFKVVMDIAMQALQQENVETRRVLVFNVEAQARHTAEIVSKVKELISADQARAAKVVKLEQDLEDMRRRLDLRYAKEVKRDVAIAEAIESIQVRLVKSEKDAEVQAAFDDLTSLAGPVR